MKKHIYRFWLILSIMLFCFGKRIYYLYADQVEQTTIGHPVPPAPTELLKAFVREPGELGEAGKEYISEDDEIDFELKRKIVKELVDRGVAYVMENDDTDVAFHAFTHSKDFRHGELYLFVYSDDGTCVAHGQDSSLLWKNQINMRDMFGSLFVQAIIKQAKRGGGWVTYNWRNATKISYIGQAVKGGRMYAIGCGYYPQSKRDSVLGLVKGAVALFNYEVKNGREPRQAFAQFSYPDGPFVLGDLYLYALRYDGLMLAQGDRPGLIGTNALDVVNTEGRKINREIIQKLDDVVKGEGIWIEYMSKNARKLAYAEKVTDNKGTNYFIACGYYPDAGRKSAVDLVRKGFHNMKENGLEITKTEINNPKSRTFRYGDLYLEVFDMKGKCLAHGNNVELVGKNFYDIPDEDGKFYVRDMIKRVQRGPVWIDYKENNLFRSVYVEKVDLGTEEYIIACGLYPVSKRESTVLLVKTAVYHLENNSRRVSFGDFVNPDGKFMRGDLGVFVFDHNGVCLAYKDEYDYIWQKMIDAKDDDGKAYVRIFINTVKTGPGYVSYRQNGAKKIAYVEPLKKGKRSYVVGSSYYI